MEREHKLNMEALARVRKFMGEEGETSVPREALHFRESIHVALGDATTLGNIQNLFSTHPERTFNAQQIKAALAGLGIELKAKNPIATISVSLKKLVDRGKVTVVRRGSGRDPHLYQAAKPSLVDDDLTLRDYKAQSRGSEGFKSSA